MGCISVRSRRAVTVRAGALPKAVAGACAPNQLLDLKPTLGEMIQLRPGRCSDMKSFHGRTVHRGSHLLRTVYLKC